MGRDVRLSKVVWTVDLFEEEERKANNPEVEVCQSGGQGVRYSF